MKRLALSLTLLWLATPATLAQLRPFVYHEGNLVWERNRWLEDNGDSVFVLSNDVVTLDPSHLQDAALGYPEMLVFNQAQFTPPEGDDPVAGQSRRLNEESIDRKGLQLYVNYGNARVDTTGGVDTRYDQGMFFVSLSENGYPINAQPMIPVPVVPFSGVTISASRGAFGTLTLPGAGTYDALYVTASVGYDPATLANAPYAQAAALDRLYLEIPGTGWLDVSWTLPIGVRASNNSGVAFGDFDGDGVEEIYVGRQGNDFGGLPDALLRLNPTTGYFNEDTAMIPSPYSGATTDVQASDIDQDGDLDIVVANRSPRTSAQTPFETNFALINDGVSQFTMIPLPPAAGKNSDSRSVAVADVVGDAREEIVFGNAGSDGFTSSGAELAVADDDPMQVWAHTSSGGVTSFHDVTLPQAGVPTVYLGGALPGDVEERKWTSGLTFQVLLQDIVTPVGTSFTIEPDGLPDLIVVNHRYALNQAVAVGLGSTNNIQILANQSALHPAQSIFTRVKTLDIDWAKTVCFADYVKYASINPAVLDGRIEPFVGTGNRFAASLNRVFRAVSQNAWSETSDGSVHFDSTYDTIPGNERGYGFDFATTGVFGEGLDAVQGSRGYQFLTLDMLHHDSTPANWSRHWDISEPRPHSELGTPGPHLPGKSVYHRRGMSEPKGGEDGCFANLDDDPELELLFVGSRSASRPHPDPTAGAAIVSVFNSTNPNSYNDHSRTLQPFVDLTTGATDSYYVDDKINRGTRDASPTAQNADRIVAADLDNDGDLDAIASLFPVQDHSGASAPGYVHDMTYFHPNTDRFNFGFMYLEGVPHPNPTDPWFVDVATTKMTDDVLNPPVFLPTYNRGLGDIGLVDLDNNGAIDLFSVQSPEKDLSNADSVIQLRELIFLNGIKGDAVGTLREMSATIFPPGPVGSYEFGPAPDIVARQANEPQSNAQMACGGSSVDWGDVDNDGDVDLLVARGVSNYPGLLINNGLPGDQLRFDDAFAARVPVAALDPAITSTVAYQFGSSNLIPGIDGSTQARFIDIDGDGDLDMILTVPNQMLRVLRNKGADTDGNGFIDSNDTAPLGYFEDITSVVQDKEQRVMIDSSDTQVVDIDRDGDYDFASNGWYDEVGFWRNDRTLELIPHVTEIWPRIGAVRGSTITLRGANLDYVNVVSLTYKNSVELIYPITPSGDPHEMTVTLPANLPVGFARVHVAVFLPGVFAPSKQYVGYCVLGN